ncbi:hypothetical protein BKA63DRAFT_563997 [Paraphoma chrysanthemicola]|nr:hypothetical protein BKA63DRAFT_563997 [Paraphoma chrysanthemicola]
MVNSRASDVPPPQIPTAPVVKRKRRASCLGEQERRERKRAIDREAQRSLREKTKTHIAELERTIQILRDQDRNGATASLLSEIDVLRAENERLKDVIESVKSVVGCDLVARNAASNTAPGNDGGSPTASSIGQRSPKRRAISFADDTKPALPTPLELANPFDFQERVPNTSRPLDLDGLTVTTGMEVDTSVAPDTSIDLNLDLEPLGENNEVEAELAAWNSDPATARWGSMMAEFFGPNWLCPSPVVLHIDNPAVSQATKSAVACPISNKCDEILGKVFSYRSSKGTSSLSFLKSETAEAGLLYLGIKEGWEKTSNEWMQSPVIQILKQVDDLLFRRLPKVERLATGYKNYKLLKYYLNATKADLDKVPEWLRPSLAQSSFKHPLSIDFFAWPTLRDRLLQMHEEYRQSSAMSKAYPQYLRFEWPFAFEDAFFYDEQEGTHYPSPLFERYHRDLKHWTMDPKFYETFPEMLGDIEGDRVRFSEVDVN